MTFTVLRRVHEIRKKIRTTQRFVYLSRLSGEMRIPLKVEAGQVCRHFQKRLELELSQTRHVTREERGLDLEFRLSNWCYVSGRHV